MLMICGESMPLPNYTIIKTPVVFSFNDLKDAITRATQYQWGEKIGRDKGLIINLARTLRKKKCVRIKINSKPYWWDGRHSLKPEHICVENNHFTIALN